MAIATSSTVNLSVSRFIKAPPESVFNAWTKPEELVKWFGPETCRALSAKIDLRVGGKFRLRVNSDDMGELELTGVYREVEAPQRLAFTWNVSGNPTIEIPETLVTVDFIPVEEGTDVQIMHEDFPSPAMRDDHNQGWNGSLDKLCKLLDPEQCYGAQPPVGTFCWNELMARDLGAATTFYNRLFDWETADSPVEEMQYKMFKQQMRMVGGAMPLPSAPQGAKDVPQPSPQWLAYVRVSDVDAKAQKVVSLGGKVCHGPIDIPNVGRIAVIQDPQGAALGLFAPSKTN